MKKLTVLFALFALVTPIMAEETPATATQTKDTVAAEETSLKKKFYYGYNFDIYFHNDTRDRMLANGWSFSLTPEFGYRLSEKAQVGLRIGGSYYSQTESYTIKYDISHEEDVNLKVRGGAWEIAPYGRYRLTTLFNEKLGIWLELHGYTCMTFPTIVGGDPKGTDYDGLKHTISYGAQLSPLITFKFNEKSTFNFFFSILSLGYSGTTRVYKDESDETYREYSNDVILFSGKLSNLIANQFTPALYGIKFGVQKSF